MDNLALKIFSFLRFPLMVGVIMTHCDISGDISSQINHTLGTKWSYDLMYFFSNIIGRFSVPMFFLISGFLFFRSRTLTNKQYVTKLHNRLYTLLIPYLLWNLIAFPYFVIKHYPHYTLFFNELQKYK